MIIVSPNEVFGDIMVLSSPPYPPHPPHPSHRGAVSIEECIYRVNMPHMVKFRAIKGKYAQIRVIKPKYSQI